MEESKTSSSEFILKEEICRDKLVFMKRFIDSMLSGFTHDEIKFFGDSLVHSYFECVYFVILKRIKPILLSEKKEFYQN